MRNAILLARLVSSASMVVALASSTSCFVVRAPLRRCSEYRCLQPYLPWSHIHQSLTSRFSRGIKRLT